MLCPAASKSLFHARQNLSKESDGFALFKLVTGNVEEASTTAAWRGGGGGRERPEVRCEVRDEGRCPRARTSS